MMQAELTMRSIDRRTALAAWLTVERVAYAGLALLALGLRAYGLGWQPLGPAEAAQALPAWAAVQGQTFTLTGTSPLLVTLQRLLFTPFGATDALARWWPALLGGLAPLLFYFLRDRLTRGGALLAALLWAISPLAVFTGRLGLGYGLAPPLALAVLAGIATATRGRGDAGTRGQGDAETRGRGEDHPVTKRQPSPSDAQHRRHLVMAAVSLGLLLTAGPGAYTVLLIGLAAALVWRGALPRLWAAVQTERRRLLLGLLASLLLAATFFLNAPAGLAATADLLGQWFRGLAPAAGEFGAWDVLRRLLLGEPLLIGFAVAGWVTTVRRRDRFGTFAALAAGLALLAPLIGRGRHPADLGLVVLALTLSAGPAMAHVLRRAYLTWRDEGWRGELDAWLLVALTLALLAAAAICLPSAVTPANNANWRQLYATVGIVTAVLAAALWVVYGVWGSWGTVARALPLAPLLFGLAWGVSQISGLNYDRGAWRQAAILAETPASGLGELQAALGELSALQGGAAREIRVDLVLPTAPGDPLAPTLRWALRDFMALRVTASVPADLAPIVITAAEDQPVLSDRYTGAEFSILQRWTPEALGDLNARLRWVLYREAKTAAEGRSVVLWVDRTKQ